MKYPGGYQIIDLGDLSAIPYTTSGGAEITYKIPGIYKKISESNKPVLFTGHGITPALQMTPHDILFAKVFAADGTLPNPWQYNIVTALLGMNGTITVYGGILISSSDQVAEYDVQ